MVHGRKNSCLVIQKTPMTPRVRNLSATKEPQEIQKKNAYLARAIQQNYFLLTTKCQIQDFVIDALFNHFRLNRINHQR